MGQHSQVLKQSLSMANGIEGGWVLVRDKPQPQPGCSIKRCLGIYSLDLLQVLIGVLVRHIGRTDVKFEIWPKVFKVVVVWKL